MVMVSVWLYGWVETPAESWGARRVREHGVGSVGRPGTPRLEMLTTPLLDCGPGAAKATACCGSGAVSLYWNVKVTVSPWLICFWPVVTSRSHWGGMLCTYRGFDAEKSGRLAPLGPPAAWSTLGIARHASPTTPTSAARRRRLLIPIASCPPRPRVARVSRPTRCRG